MYAWLSIVYLVKETDAKCFEKILYRRGGEKEKTRHVSKANEELGKSQAYSICLFMHTWLCVHEKDDRCLGHRMVNRTVSILGIPGAKAKYGYCGGTYVYTDICWEGTCLLKAEGAAEARMGTWLCGTWHLNATGRACTSGMPLTWSTVSSHCTMQHGNTAFNSAWYLLNVWCSWLWSNGVRFVLCPDSVFGFTLFPPIVHNESLQFFSFKASSCLSSSHFHAIVHQHTWTYSTLFGKLVMQQHARTHW